jgi:hypothetical protein
MDKDKKRVLSAQVDKETIDQLNAICKAEKRSQAKTLEILIEKEAKRLKL